MKYGLRLSILGFLGFIFERRNNLKIETVDLHFRNLPKSFHLFRIAQLSDLHASYWVDRKYLMRAVETANQLAANLTVITGDMITGAVNNFWKRWLPVAKRDYVAMVTEVLSHLKGSNKIAVLGNHDQWDGIETENRLVRELEKIGVTVLRNRSVPLFKNQEQVYIAGIDDVWFSHNLTQALAGIPNSAFKILLSHSPDIMSDVRRDMKIDLTITGHTHGGQVAIPYLSHHFIPIDNPARYLSGLVKEPYGYTCVNRGIGTLVFPFRYCTPPEITCFRLYRS